MVETVGLTPVASKRVNDKNKTVSAATSDLKDTDRRVVSNTFKYRPDSHANTVTKYDMSQTHWRGWHCRRTQTYVGLCLHYSTHN